MKKLVLIFTLFYFVACNQKTKEASKSIDKSINQSSRSMSILKDLVLTNGDEDAYYELKMAYLDFEYPEEFLIYAMTMANKYDNAEAYFDVYTCLKNIYYSDITRIDEKSSNLAIDYLLKANDKNNEQAQEIVKEYSVNNEIIDKRALIIKINK